MNDRRDNASVVDDSFMVFVFGLQCTRLMIIVVGCVRLCVLDICRLEIEIGQSGRTFSLSHSLIFFVVLLFCTQDMHQKFQ